jgi:hypothetical protein
MEVLYRKKTGYEEKEDENEIASNFSVYHFDTDTVFFARDYRTCR